MATNKIEIWNMALTHLNARNQISSAAEDSNEAAQCRLFYDTARDTVLAAIGWRFAEGRVSLAQTANTPTGWAYEYTQPSDTATIRRIYNSLDPNGSDEPPIKFETGHNGTAPVIWTDQYEADVIYTRKFETVAHYPAPFVLALSFYLAYLIAPKLAKAEMKESLLGEYRLHLSQASAIDLNQGYVGENDMPAEWTRDRA